MPSVSIQAPTSNSPMPPVISGRYTTLALPGGPAGGAVVQVKFTPVAGNATTPVVATLDADGPGTWKMSKPTTLPPGVYTIDVSLTLPGMSLASASNSVTGVRN